MALSVLIYALLAAAVLYVAVRIWKFLDWACPRSFPIDDKETPETEVEITITFESSDDPSGQDSNPSASYTK